MTTPRMQRLASRSTVVWLFVVANVVLLVLVWVQAYAARVEMNRSSRAGCERSKLDRSANAQSWRTQARADWVVATDPAQPARTRRIRMEASQIHSANAAELERRSRIDCRRAFPAPSLLP